MVRASKSTYSRPTPPGHKVALRGPRFTPPTFICHVCRVDVVGEKGFYHPLLRGSSRKLLCEGCAVWLGGIRHADERHPTAPKYAQLVLLVLDDDKVSAPKVSKRHEQRDKGT